MADKSDELWSKALWPDCLNEPGGSLMGMISDADMLHMIEESGKHSEHDTSDVRKDTANVPDVADDALDLEPPAKMQATSKLDSQAAKTKAHREKQRRAQLNNRYTELAALTDPSKTPKTDRNLILDDAVRVITQLRVENNQLRQLNKLLEERVQEQEAPRGQALYQSYLMSQGGLQPVARVDGASTSTLMNVPAPPDASGPREMGKQNSHHGSLPGPAAAPSTDPSVLAVQMMNVAMQLLQNKPGGGGAPDQPGHAPGMPPQSPTHPAHWGGPQHGGMPGMLGPGPPQHGVQQGPQPGTMMGYADSGHIQVQGDQIGGPPSGSKGGEGGVTVAGTPAEGGSGQPGNTSLQDNTRDATQQQSGSAAVPVPCMGFKPQVLQAHSYMGGYQFAGMPAMPSGWAPSSMMDQARDSKLRPPAA